jgi:hypothetical protein
MTCHAFCFLIMQVSAKELTALLTKPSLQGIPLLVLGNKNDLPGALGTQQLIERMGLQVRTRLGRDSWLAAVACYICSSLWCRCAEVLGRQMHE